MATNYFSLFDNITLNDIQSIDLFKQFSFNEYLPNSEDLFNFINIIDTDTPESLAERFYGSKKYYWIILLANKTKDFFYEWPLTNTEVRTYCDKRLKDIRASMASDQEFMDTYISYGQTGLDYSALYSSVLDAMYNDLVTINDNSRTLKYLKPRFLDDFVSAITEKF
jgi:hypothetical protein